MTEIPIATEIIEIQIAEPLLLQENEHLRNQLRINYTFVISFIFVIIFYAVYFFT